MNVTFDDAGRLTSSKDALNNPTTYTNYLDASGQPVKKTIYADASTLVETAFKDRSAQKVDGTAVHGMRFDAGVETESGTQRGYVKEIKIDASGADTSEWIKTYSDMLGQPYKVLFADNAFSQTYYNTNGQPFKEVDPDGVTTLVQYNARGEPEYSAIDINTNGTIDFAGLDRITRRVTVYTNNGAADVRRTSTYVWSTTNLDAATLISVAERSVNGLRSWNSSFGLTNHARSVYLNGHRYETNTAPDDSYSVSDFQYGRLLSVTHKDANGNQIGAVTNGFDAHGRLATETDARTGATTYGYDNADGQTSVTTPTPGSGQSAQTTTIYYNRVGLVTNRVEPDGGSIVSSYFPTRELATNSGARTYAVAYTYDYAGRTNTMTTWQNFATKQGAAITTWQYDAYRGFVTNKLYADGKGAGYTLTAAGRPKTRTWARGLTTTYSYNDAGEVSTLLYSDGAAGMTNTYDRRGRPTSVIQGTNTGTMLYGDAGQLLSETANSLTISNDYDLYLRRTNAGVWNGSAWLTRAEYTYDNASRLQKVGDGSNSATYAYVPNSSLIDTITFKENAATRVTTTKTWDNLNRLKKIETLVGSTPVSSHSYAYNSANQRTSVTNAASARWLYAYDALGQVTSGKKYWADSTPVAGQQFEYTFDDIGNRKVTASGGNEWGSNLPYARYTANNLNQYTSRTVPGSLNVLGTATNSSTVTVNDGATYRKADYYYREVTVDNTAAAVYQGVTNLAVLNQGTNADIVTNLTGNLFLAKTPELFTYDLDGNQTSNGRWTNNWDAENRWIEAETISTVPTAAKQKLVFGYDWQGRRTSKIVSNWVGSAWQLASNVRFVYDQRNLLAELNATNNALINSYMWGLDLSGTEHGAGGVGGLLATTSAGSGTHFYCHDGSGNVSALTSSTNGSVTAEYDQGPFFEVLRATGPMAEINHFTSSGKYWDRETDSYYYGYRYLRNGRWLLRDPLAEQGGVNLYGFVRNNPLTFFDKLGLVTINLKYQAYIEPATVTFFGQTFNGGVKIRHSVDVDTDAESLREVEKYLGPTIEYDSSGNVIGRGQATGSTVKASVDSRGYDRLRKENFFRIRMVANEGNPLVRIAPGITYEVFIYFYKCSRKVRWSGEHDRFPSHDFYVKGKLVHHFSHVSAGATPGSLFPPAPDKSFNGEDSF